MTDQTKLNKLKIFNIVMAILHAAQAVAVYVLSRDFNLPVNAGFLKFDVAAGALVPATQTVFNISLPWLVIVFFILSSLAHLIIATVYNKQYNQNLLLGINKARWVEYSLSASIMMVAIALLVGVYDLSSLIMIFALTSVMNLMGLVMEIHNQTTKTTNWLSYWIGTLSGIIPWVVVSLYFWASFRYGSGDIPTFVYWIYVSIFIFFSSFALNMVLQYKKVGKWKDYLYGEKAYIVLSLVAKSLLAWQIFAGTLRP